MSDVYEATLKAGQVYHSMEVSKNTKGYTWSVKIAGADFELIKTRVVEAEKFCSDKYGNKGE
jgi:hypothetical protein